LIVDVIYQNWGTFGQVVGGASGALVGLLFVAVSLNRPRIVKHVVLRASALQTLLVLMLPLFVAILLTTPRESQFVLGCEFIALGCLEALSDFITGHWRRKHIEALPTRFARLVSNLSPNLLTALLTTTSGALLAAGNSDGVYLVVPIVLLALVGGITNAWLFLMTDLD
jgi:modulator of FtsH protease